MENLPAVKKKGLLILCVSVMLLMLTACQKDAGSIVPETRTIIDMAGREVTIPSEVNRICSSGTAQNQLMMFLGEGDKICATLAGFSTNPWVQKVLPSITSVPMPFTATELNIEELIKTKPDVVTLWSGTEKIQKQLDEVGIPYVLIYSTTDGFIEGISLMAEILGKDAKAVADNFIEYYSSNMKKVSDVTSSIPAEKRKKVYYVTDNPLNTEGKDSIVTSWIETAGGVNVAAENGITGLTATISLENIIQWNPDVIIIRDAKNKDLILKNPAWQGINAVKQGQLYVNPKGVNVWSARSADGALQPLWAAKRLYPDLFTAINVEEETRNFYKEYYHYDLSDEELETVIYQAGK